MHPMTNVTFASCPLVMYDLPRAPLRPLRSRPIQFMKNILSYDEYQRRARSVATVQDVTIFAEELIAPMLEKLRGGDSLEEESGLEKAHSPHQSPEPNLPYRPHAAPRLVRTTSRNDSTPVWHDVVGNETEAKVIGLYAKGLTTRDIVSYLKRIDGVDMSQPAVSGITDKVFPLVKEWQSRPLAACYPIVYLDGLHFKVRDAGKIVSKFAYIALGVNQWGHKEVLGVWISESEGAKFWMQVLNELKNRGIDDILIVCVDGLKGFPEAIRTIYPNAEVQTCVVHQIRHTVKFVPHKDRKRFCESLKAVYQSPTEEAGLQALKEVQDAWPQYRFYLKTWEDHWADLTPFFGYPEAIRRMIYTTNAIESLNHQFRKVTKTTTVFPHDDSLLKLLWLAQGDIADRWTFAVRNWGEIMAQLTILFPDRAQF